MPPRPPPASRIPAWPSLPWNRPRKRHPWDDFSFPFPHCFVVGHEVHGVQPSILHLVDSVVEIPMAGMKHSLNVAVSFGILAFRVRQLWLAKAGVTGAS